MSPDVLHAVEKNGAILDLSSRAKLQLTGTDRVRYLNGQVTNDVRHATRQEAVYACVTNVKGRIEADVFLHVAPNGEGFLLDAEPDLRDFILLRLEKYIIADDAILTDVTEEWNLLHGFGPACSVLETWASENSAQVHRIAAARLGEPGMDYWFPSSLAMPDLSGVLSPGDGETLRILRGIPRWPQELNTDAFPQEAGLESRAMDFSKGCYIGQEILSRIKTTGKMPRTLISWRAADSSAPLNPGQLPLPLLIRDEHSALHEVGVMTSAVRHPSLDCWVGLGYVRQAEARAHSVLLAGDGAISICIDVNFSKA